VYKSYSTEGLVDLEAAAGARLDPVISTSVILCDYLKNINKTNLTNLI
jgi:hypothetical protein